MVFNDVYPECRNKTLVFHNLIDREEICRKAELPGGFSDAYSGKRILTVGRLTAQKAYELAIDAMKLLKDQGVKARWYVLGEGELRNKLQQKIDSLGLKEDFLLLGAKENPYPYYKQCDLYVHATRFEGKSIAIQDKTNHVTKKRNHTVITHVFNLGYGSGLQLGYKYAVRKGYRYVIQMDADGQHDVCNLLEIYKELQKEDENGKLPDIVLGSRFMEGSSGFSVSFAKKIAFVWFRIMLKTGTGRRITDPTTGLQGLNWRTFLFYSKYNNFDDKYPDANMLMQMLLLGFRVREIPAVMHVRTTGVSMHSGLKPVLYMFRMTFSILAVWIREKILKMDEDKIHELEKYDE